MTLEQFNQQKKKIKLELEDLLDRARKQQNAGVPVHRKSLLKPITVTFTVMHKENTEEEFQKVIDYKLKHKDAELEIRTKTDYSYCKDSPVGTYFKFITYELVDEITEQMVQNRMKQFVRNKLGLTSVFEDLKCEVMQLFKDGKISWNDVVKQHKEGCRI